ncbi:MAG: ThiF family adenylyltransferase [Planctomycetota bacterium]
MSELPNRYLRQMRLPGFGPEGQRRLRDARVLVAGCGALGTVVCEQLVRAGLGTLVVVDRDVVEPSNLQRQTLFTEQDALRRTPKAEAAKSRLRQVNAECVVRALVDDLHAGNVLRHAQGCDLIVDCLDNFETRYLLNDCAVELGVPLVYGGAVGMRGMAAGLLPATGAGRTEARVSYAAAHATACLRCIAPEPPPAGEVETCDTVGVLAPAAAIAASIEAGIALRLLAEGAAAVPAALVRFDLATLAFSSASLAGARDAACPCCARGERRFLRAAVAPWRVLCGRNAVELRLAEALDEGALARIGRRLGVEVEPGARAVRGVINPASGVTDSARGVLDPASGVIDSARGVIDSARGVAALQVLCGESGALVIVEGTTDPERARAAVAALVGL